MSWFKTINLCFTGLILTTGGIAQSQTIDGSGAEIFILNEGDVGEFTTLRFGSLSNKFLQWDTTNLRFNLNDTLRVSGNLEQEGGVMTFDADNNNVGADVDIVANQGSDADGILRYSAANDRWEISNDGGNFEALGGGGGSFTGFDATLANDASTSVTHAEDSERYRVVQVKELITATGGIDNSLDFETVDEGVFIQENAAIGTDFLSESARLHATFSGTDNVNLALSQPVTASSATQPATNAVDGNDGSFWYTTTGNSNGGWVQVDLGSSAPPINQAQVRWYNATGTYNCSTFEIQGSNTDGSGYTTVYTGNTVADPQESTYNFTPSVFQYWRFLCTTANNASFYVVNEVRLFEALATYPTTPYYVTTNTNRLNTSSWTGLTNFDITQTQPANTTVNYLVSFDAGVTWKYWNGSAWTNSSLANLQTEGMNEAILESLTGANWFAAGGINSDASQTLDFAFDLYTTNNATTPSVDQISLTYSSPTFWQIQTQNYDIQEFSDTQTQITNRSGSTKDIKISVIIP